jgi:hypothetical protein
MFCLESEIFLGAWTYARFLDFCICRVFLDMVQQLLNRILRKHCSEDEGWKKVVDIHQNILFL